MLRVALKMLTGDRPKYAGLIFGIAFTSFLVTFAASFFCGFMTRSFALVSENPDVDAWVMDPSMATAEQATNMESSALSRVRGVAGVALATPLAVATTDVRFPNGRSQSFQVIGVDDDTLRGVPRGDAGSDAPALRSADATLVAEGGSTGKLETPALPEDTWPADGPHLEVPTRTLRRGDELEANDHRIVVGGVVNAMPRFPPRPLLYMSFSNASRIVLPERHRLTFVLVTVAEGASPQEVARRIESQTGLKARTSAEFESETVRWFLVNSEDVGDVTAMLLLAMCVGIGVTAVMFYMFTSENLKQYAVLKAMGATRRTLLVMTCVQVGTCALYGSGIGLGACGIVGMLADRLAGFPFRMMWFTPILGLVAVILISAIAAAVSVRPVLKLEPAIVFAGR
jgi:putative ABC transport system permease protein